MLAAAIYAFIACVTARILVACPLRRFADAAASVTAPFVGNFSHVGEARPRLAGTVGVDTLFWDDKHIRQPVYARINARLLLQPRFHDIDHVTTVAYAPCTNTSLLMHHMWSQDKWDAIDEEGLLAC